MKRKSIITIILCALFSSAFCIAAFAGDYDTPVVPIHTKHYYYVLSVTQPTCTEVGVKTYKCRQCTSTYTEDIAPLGHMFCYDGSTNETGVELYCRYCNATEVVDAQSLEEFWNTDYINEKPNRIVSDEDKSGYLDLDGNNIINAKDYAMIISFE